MTRRTSPRARAAAERSDLAGLSASRLRLFGVALVCAKVALVPLVFDYGSDAPFTVAKALLSHGLAYALAGVLVGLAISFGRSLFVRSWLHVPVLAFLAANVAATLFAADRVLALYGAHVRMLGLGSVADWVLLYFAIVMLVRTRGEAIAVFACGSGASLLVLAYESVQLLGRDPFSWNTDVTSRPFSTIGQPNSLAQYLTTVAIGAASVGLLVQAMARPARAFMFVVAGLLLAGAGATATRSAVLGLVAGSAFLVVMIWFLHPSRWARVASLIGAGGAIAVVAALLLLTPIGARLATTFDSPPLGDDASDEPLARLDASSDTRAGLYAIAFQMLRERPILGFGPDNFAVGVPRYRAERASYEIRQSLPTSAHGWITHVASTSGLVGLGAFIAIGVCAVALTLRSGFRPLAVTGAAMLVAFVGTGLTTIDDVGVDWLFWVAAGMVAVATAAPSGSLEVQAAPQFSERGGRNRGSIHKSQFRRIAPMVCAAAGLVLALPTVAALDASRSNRSAQQSRLQGKSAEAIALALRATGSDAGRAEYWDGLGLAYISGSRLPQATSAFERAHDLAPYDVRYTGDLARSLLLRDSGGESGLQARAIQLAEEAARTDPNNPLANLTRAVVMQTTGDLQEATRSIDRALALDPQSGNAQLYLTATQVYLASGRASDAVPMARQGIEHVWPPPKSVPIRIELARALVTTGQTAEALTEVDAALAIQPNEPTAQRLRAEIQARLPR